MPDVEFRTQRPNRSRQRAGHVSQSAHLDERLCLSGQKEDIHASGHRVIILHHSAIRPPDVAGTDHAKPAVLGRMRTGTTWTCACLAREGLSQRRQRIRAIGYRLSRPEPFGEVRTNPVRRPDAKTPGRVALTASRALASHAPPCNSRRNLQFTSAGLPRHVAGMHGPSNCPEGDYLHAE